uniref:SWI/SNF-related matrix-associated actin-dependent regulator of chromatin subfamily A containing DEAD/H box 1 homolog n=1 Tax=Lepeophtheirus salmonis TaxID=72036 RepID=A0A0K2U565_LEPSM
MSMTPMSSLRQFRFQKHSEDSIRDSPSPEPKKRHYSGDEDIHITTKKKRARVLSSDSDSSPVKCSPDDSPPLNTSPPPVDSIERKVNFIVSMFKSMDRSMIRDTLIACDEDVESAIKKIKGAKAKKHIAVINLDSDDEEYSSSKVYHSDSDSDSQEVFTSSADRTKVLDFFNTGALPEILGIQGCSKKKAEGIVDLRPYKDWEDLVRKIKCSRSLNTEMLNSAMELLEMKNTMSKLMDRCQRITAKIGGLVSTITRGDFSQMELTEQPKNFTTKLKLKDYQMIGLNWLVLMHKQSLNGVLADEMGLGKTVQAISFLAHLKETGNSKPHLIVVPSSTMDNWEKEIETWCPSLSIVKYYGSQEERQKIRYDLVRENLEYDILLTTYSMVVSSAEDKSLFKKISFHYVVFDEAHMLKNMSTSRYENLMRVKAPRKLLLTGTPLQNNLVELMSLLVFVMPELFANKKDLLKKVFSLFPKASEKQSRSNYEQERIAHAKHIMKPFFLRRLKVDVIKNLPPKNERVEKLPLTSRQHEHYFKLVSVYKEKAKLLSEGKASSNEDSGIGMLMNLRKTANHPLLIRSHYDENKLKKLANILKNDPSHKNAVEKFIVDDLGIMSDYDIHKTCLLYKCIEDFRLSNEYICESGKFEYLDKLLPKMKENDDRILLFTQFTMVLDIIEDYLKIRGHNYIRLDGSTPVTERQYLIDDFNQDSSIFIFILSTKAGGLGINLTSANTVILHDLDFNPYNDKQAEDRCHRVGQTRPVSIIRLISEGTIEEGIYSVAQEKLKLEQDLTGADDDTNKVKHDVASLLKTALDVEMSDQYIGEVKNYI